MRNTLQKRSKPRALTVLELLMAITIFSLVSLAVFSVFSAGTRAYEATHRDAALLQRSRYVFDQFESDIMQLFYRDEDEYNEQARRVLQQYQQALQQYEQTGDEALIEPYIPCPEGDEDCLNDPSHIGNPYEKATMIDLQLVGESGGETDSITFAIRQPYELGKPYMPWGLARVNYTVENDYLIRSMESVEVAPRTWDGKIMEKSEPPMHAIVAKGVLAFDLSYAFWWDNQWYETEAWSSGERKLRNSLTLMGEYDEDVLEGQYSQFAQQQNLSAYDRVPTYVRVRLKIADPEAKGRSIDLTRIFRIPNSQETWTINEQLEEDDREMERYVRDQQFTPVYPGASRKI